MKRITSITTRFWNGPTMRTALRTAMSRMAAIGVPKRLLTMEIDCGNRPSAESANSGRAPEAR